MDNQEYIKDFIARAIREDVGDGDHTSLSTIPSDQRGKAQLLVKQDGILAGVEVARMVFETFDKDLKMTTFITDGTPVKKGDVAFIVEGRELSILQTERLVLNFMQRMSGIATQTSKYVELVKGLHTKILDTRKTTPGMRVFEKMAVVMGGGQNHRIGLYDMILIKDNHIDFAGGIEKAIDAANKYLKDNNMQLNIEVETRSLDDVARVLKHGGVQRIMFDNFTPDQIREGVKMVNHRMETEASGGIVKETLHDYAVTGVDFISVGAFTHQIRSLDMSLKAL